MKDRTSQPAFVARFDEIRSAIRRAQVCRGACWATFVAACGLAVLAVADYWLELPWSARAVGLGVVACLAAIQAVVGTLAPLLWWSRPRTAVQLEHRFAQLGQRIRTVVQFSGRAEADVVSEGVAPNLVTALEEETEARARPLDLSAVVPRRKTAVAAILAATPILLLLCGLCVDWQSRLAICRALLSNRPYTELEVTPGNLMVDQRQDATISLRLTGRVDRPILLYSRPADQADASWQQRELPPEEAQRPAADVLQQETTFERVEHPIEYRVVAGPAESDLYQVTVRYPLAIEKIEAVLTPPAYTGVEPSTVEGGDLELIEGTRVDFRVKLDRPCREAFLVLTDLPDYEQGDGTTATTQQLAMGVDRTSLAASLQFSEDKNYSIVASARDGLPLKENRYRVRVRRDQPPNVRFRDPDEALEVHPIAEILMRIRTDDDFGLSKAGIVFQVDNGPEQTLLAKEFIHDAAGQDSQQRVAPATRAVLEKMLPLEDHDLTPTRSVTYYAFAEDNFPEGPRRTETDLRFIDIRSFQRIYKVGGS